MVDKSDSVDEDVGSVGSAESSGGGVEPGDGFRAAMTRAAMTRAACSAIRQMDRGWLDHRRVKHQDFRRLMGSSSTQPISSAPVSRQSREKVQHSPLSRRASSRMMKHAAGIFDPDDGA